MPIFGLGFNWRKSQAHVMLLGCFRYPHSLDEIDPAHSWDRGLGEPLAKAVKRFIDEGLVIRVTDINRLLYVKHGPADLKQVMRQLGLKVSGNKQQLIQRWLETDPDGAKQSIANMEVYECTEKAQQFLHTGARR